MELQASQRGHHKMHITIRRDGWRRVCSWAVQLKQESSENRDDMMNHMSSLWDHDNPQYKEAGITPELLSSYINVVSCCFCLRLQVCFWSCCQADPCGDGSSGVLPGELFLPADAAPRRSAGWLRLQLFEPLTHATYQCLPIYLQGGWHPRLNMLRQPDLLNWYMFLYCTSLYICLRNIYYHILSIFGCSTNIVDTFCAKRSQDFDNTVWKTFLDYCFSIRETSSMQSDENLGITNANEGRRSVLICFPRRWTPIRRWRLEANPDCATGFFHFFADELWEWNTCVTRVFLKDRSISKWIYGDVSWYRSHRCSSWPSWAGLRSGCECGDFWSPRLEQNSKIMHNEKSLVGLATTEKGFFLMSANESKTPDWAGHTLRLWASRPQVFEA